MTEKLRKLEDTTDSWEDADGAVSSEKRMIGTVESVTTDNSWDAGKLFVDFDNTLTQDAPDAFEIDYEKMIDKTLRGPLQRIFTVLGWDFNEALADTEQMDVTEYM